MKQKITIKLQMDCDKCRNKALKIAAEVEGVNSVSIEGNEKDRVVVVGEDVDTVYLGKLLKKKFRCVLILTVEEVKPPKPPEKKEDKKDNHKPPTTLFIVPVGRPCFKCPSPKCEGQCESFSKSHSPKCDGKCPSSLPPLLPPPPSLLSLPPPPLLLPPRCTTSYDPYYRVGYDPYYQDSCSIQ